MDDKQLKKKKVQIPDAIHCSDNYIDSGNLMRFSMHHSSSLHHRWHTHQLTEQHINTQRWQADIENDNEVEVCQGEVCDC